MSRGKYTRVLLAGLLAFVLVMSALPALAYTPDNEIAPADHLPLCEPGTEELTLLTFQNWDTGSYFDAPDGLPIENLIEEKTGVKIIYECVSSDDYATVAQTRLAAGANLPDMMRVPNKTIGMTKYADQGLFVNMSEYISEENTPFIAHLFKEDPMHEAFSTASDGNIYGLPYSEKSITNVVVNYMSIRQDWLTNLGLEMPTTIEEYYKVLTAFRNDDPNGNGEKDEVPLVAMFNLHMFKTAFGLEATDDWYVNDEGKIEYGLVQPEMLDLVTEMNKWYSEGLIYTEIDAQGNAAGWRDICALDQMGGAQKSADNLLTDNSFVYDVNPDCDYVFLPLLTSEKYQEAKLTKRGAWSDYYGITVDCKNPLLAMQWLDWVWASDEAQTLKYYGIEGETFNWVDDERVYTEVVTESPLGSIGYLRSMGAFMNFVGRESGEAFLAMYPGKYPSTCLDEYKDVLVDKVEDMIGTVEETETYGQLWPDLENYVKESFIGFVIGSKPLSEWDSYVETCKTMGIEDVTAIKQAWADRAAEFK